MKTLRILSFGLSVMKNMAVMRVCQDLKSDFVLIKPEDLHKSLGFLCNALGIDEKPVEDNKSFQNGEIGEMLVFAGYDSSDLDIFLDKYKKLGMESVKNKAMLTEYNALWSPAFLWTEMEKERQERGLNKA